jgi:small subunit ribosomal protein S4e
LLTNLQAPRPTTGPHKIRECLPLSILLKNRLKYALNGREVYKIVKDKEGLIKIDHRVRREPHFPCGFMDVISIEKTGEHFRLLFDVKGRYQPHKIEGDESNFKLLKVTQQAIGNNKIPYIVTHDARTIRFQHPDIRVNDTVKYNLKTGEIEAFYKFEQGATVMIDGGKSIGRIGTISHISKHDAQFNIVHIRDARGKTFATRDSNVFVIGQDKKAGISLPKGKGLAYTIIEERDIRAKAH